VLLLFANLGLNAQDIVLKIPFDSTQTDIDERQIVKLDSFIKIHLRSRFQFKVCNYSSSNEEETVKYVNRLKAVINYCVKNGMSEKRFYTVFDGMRCPQGSVWFLLEDPLKLRGSFLYRLFGR